MINPKEIGQDKTSKEMPQGTNIDYEKLVEQMKKVATDHKLYTLKDCAAMCNIDPKTWIRKFPSGSETNESLKDIFAKNNTEIRVGLRQKWYKGKSAPAQIMLYRILADKDERQKMNQHHVDVTTGGQPLQHDYAHLDNEQLASRIAQLETLKQLELEAEQSDDENEE